MLAQFITLILYRALIPSTAYRTMPTPRKARSELCFCWHHWGLL